MYIYEIGYGTYEESCYKQYTHKKKFTENKLKSLVCKAILNSVPSSLGEMLRQDCKAGLTDRNLFHVELCYTFQTILDHNSFEQELFKLGFSRLEFQATYSLFGWSSIFDNSFTVRKQYQTKIKTRVRTLIKLKFSKLWKKLEEYKRKKRIKVKMETVGKKP